MQLTQPGNSFHQGEIVATREVPSVCSCFTQPGRLVTPSREFLPSADSLWLEVKLLNPPPCTIYQTSQNKWNLYLYRLWMDKLARRELRRWSHFIQHKCAFSEDTNLKTWKQPWLLDTTRCTKSAITQSFVEKCAEANDKNSNTTAKAKAKLTLTHSTIKSILLWEI